MGDVFFDATVWRKALAQRLRSEGVAIDYPTLCRRWEAKLVDVYLGRRKYWDAFREFLGDLGLDEARAAKVLAFARETAAAVENRVLFDGVAETLARLKAAGLKLAVLSDTESREPRVRQRLAQLGIEAHFDAVVSSVDIEHVKPERQAFTAALARLGVPAAETLFVSHDGDELQGAKRAGLTTVAYNYSEPVPADHHIRHFSELLGLAGAAGRGEQEAG